MHRARCQILPHVTATPRASGPPTRAPYVRPGAGAPGPAEGEATARSASRHPLRPAFTQYHHTDFLRANNNEQAYARPTTVQLYDVRD